MEQDAENTNEMIERPDKDARNWAMICHLSGLVGFVMPFGNVLGPLIVWAIKKDDDPFINDQGKEALNYQLTMTLCLIISAILILVVIGILLISVLCLYILFMIIIASINANDGVYYRYPLTIRFFK
ncbi:MAG: DUF4870 domain-containing protein [Gammaproteobacteria bacterium]|nr:DUF4870 domain-containing protein [Gammaproteobacteria bacterium]